MAQGRDSHNDISIELHQHRAVDDGREATEAPPELSPVDWRSQRPLLQRSVFGPKCACGSWAWLANQPGGGDTTHGNRCTCRWTAAAAAWPADLAFVVLRISALRHPCSCCCGGCRSAGRCVASAGV